MTLKLALSLALPFAILIGCRAADAAPASAPASQPEAPKGTYAAQPDVPAGHARAIFAGGCFWCLEKDFEHLPGVLSVTSGYIGGHKDRPTYGQVSSRTTGHAEAIVVVYDTKVRTYDDLLEHFWVNIDPTTDDRQFCDRGDEYRPEIFPVDAAQLKEAKASLAKVSANKPFRDPIKVKITPVFPEGKSVETTFFTAEIYHQDFYKKSPRRYNSYRSGCGRDARLKQLWGARAGG